MRSSKRAQLDRNSPTLSAQSSSASHSHACSLLSPACHHSDRSQLVTTMVSYSLSNSQQSSSRTTPQLIRIRSKEGNFRFELQPEDDISVLLAKVSSILGTDSKTGRVGEERNEVGG